MSKARKVLDNWLQKVISANPNDWNYTTDLALSELRGLVMGMRKRGCMGKECSCVKEDDKTFNRAVEAIADELFGET